VKKEKEITWHLKMGEKVIKMLKEEKIDEERGGDVSR